MKNYKPGWHSRLLSKLKLIVAILLVSGLICRCSISLYMPIANDAEKAGTSLDTLMAGRNLYIDRCSGCHNLYLPGRFTATKWQKNVNEMQKKAKINDDQKTVILKYLTAKCRE